MVHRPPSDPDSPWKEVGSLSEVTPRSRMDTRRAGSASATRIDFGCDSTAVNSQFYDHDLRSCRTQSTRS